MFQYLMKLHYSQTDKNTEVVGNAVSVPYEITLLSNYQARFAAFFGVSVPYEITLLSNRTPNKLALGIVSVPYEITLLSNRCS